MSKSYHHFSVILVLKVFVLSFFLVGTLYGERFFEEADRFMEKYVQAGNVKYQAIKNNPIQLKSLLRKIETFNLGKVEDSVEMAFWINAYNLLVINAIVTHYPLNSPMDIQGFFDTKKYSAAGEQLTLNEIENIKLRKKFKDARIHFALVCAALSCPPIIPDAYSPATLDNQLNERTKQNLNDTGFIRIDVNQKRVEISEIFKWYEADFTADGQTVLQYINRYRDKKILESYEVGYYQYDWNLNQAKS